MKLKVILKSEDTFVHNDLTWKGCFVKIAEYANQYDITGYVITGDAEDVHHCKFLNGMLQ